ncbi:uncharacterized protein WM277_002064 [Molossus nigricans]
MLLAAEAPGALGLGARLPGAGTLRRAAGGGCGSCRTPGKELVPEHPPPPTPAPLRGSLPASGTRELLRERTFLLKRYEQLAAEFLEFMIPAHWKWEKTPSGL